MLSRVFDDNAFHPRWHNGVFELLARHHGGTHRLTWADSLVYDHPMVIAELDPETACVKQVRPHEGLPDEVAIDWSVCLAMIVLGRGLQRSAPGLSAACAHSENAQGGEG